MLWLLVECFSWLPLPLAMLVRGVLFLFAVFVVFSLLKLIFTVLRFFYDVVQGLFGKVVLFFV